MNDWNIQSRSHACQSCEVGFEDKQPYFTLLFDEKRELKRLDVCEPCWKSKFAGNAIQEKNLISRWQGVYEAPPPAPPEPIQKENAESLLRKLIELNDPSHAAACFILAVMLERKRILKVKEQIKRDGQRIFVYEHPKTGDMFTIADPDLQLDQLEQVQRDVSNLLEHGLNPPQPQEQPAGTAEAATTGEAAAPGNAAADAETAAEEPAESAGNESPAEEPAEPVKN